MEKMECPDIDPHCFAFAARADFGLPYFVLLRAENRRGLGQPVYRVEIPSRELPQMFLLFVIIILEQAQTEL